MDQHVRAPEIDQPGLEWFNVKAPLSLEALRGKVVILDFWTFCCINCIQIIPTLRRVEEAFPDEVVVIGVHSPKFAAERDGANVAQAIARYQIVHPVVHDPEHGIWRAYAVRAWPTLVFIGPDGALIGQVSGEPDPERLLQAMDELIEDARKGGALAPAPLSLIEPTAQGGRFLFPGKMKRLPRADGGRHWAIADGGHHQVAILDEDGAEVARIGSGARGLEDGPLRNATFDAPQGLIGAEDTIYVADTGNHAIRRIDLTAGEVTTLAGTGRRGTALGDVAPAASTDLASVWDLERLDGRLFFANAGSHQLGVLDLEAGTVRALAGTGGEDIVDGPAGQALLAQPSGLALGEGGGQLYFVDSETSSVRALSLGPSPKVTTLVGTGLFDFGHGNGPLSQARFQHPLGIAAAAGRLYVADSYNGALRVIDLAGGTAADVDPGDFTCADPVCLPAGEPAGVAVDGTDRLFLVDTNNHRVLEYRPGQRSYRTWAS